MKKRCLGVLLTLALALVLVVPALADDAVFLEYVQELPNGTITYGATVWTDSKRFDGWYLKGFSEGITEITLLDRVSYEKDGVDYSGSVKIQGSAFENNTTITKIVLPEGIKSLDYAAFSGCTALTSIKLPASLVSIGQEAFADCTALTSIVIPEGVTNIGIRAFQNCTALTSISLPSTLTRLAMETFKGCTSLEYITLPKGITAINNKTFEDCTGLKSVVIPSTVTEIGEYAFSGCAALDNVVLPEGLTTLKRLSFWNCAGLTSITIPGSVTEIGGGVFRGCTSLTSAAFCEGATKVGQSMFFDCTSLPSVTLPSSMTEIGEMAFYNCKELKDVFYAGTEAEWKNVTVGSFNDPIKYATTGYNGGAIHYNSPMPEAPKQPAEPEKPSIEFTDVAKGEWYEEPVLWAVEKNITVGTDPGKFSPTVECTQIQILTFLWRAAGRPDSSVEPAVPVTENADYAGAARWATEKKMVGADFNPNAPCTRASAVKFIWQAMDMPDAGSAASFSDIATNADYAGAVSWAVKKGVTKGTSDTTFEPDKVCDRSEIVTFLYRAYK